ncbi:hypothetical protein [Thioclava sp. DLFJ4-1]|uniref:hypothetical protein n=1 Tax=Thioclava sp. DLFJ4-1 TaxID=1915313 RepID=UPI000996409C|nr:hypothetical protein [Thioclava sp. DLFJ4-1]OOY15077.1 hypothetical protein BMI85_16145 [Thioclava sp. DLFJ4-1]
MTLQTQIETQAETISRLNTELARYRNREAAHLRIIEKQAHTIEQYRKQADLAAMARAIFKEQG